LLFIQGGGIWVQRIQLEGWALDIIDRVQRHAFEDANVELKRVWPSEHEKAAWQLAGQANAARGEPVLWLIGVDEKEGAVGAPEEELANWWSQLSRWFEPPAPRLDNVTTFVKGRPLVALVFDTAARPFVVRRARNGNEERLIPWREGNSTRTAHRSEMLRLLAPSVLLPEFDVRRFQAEAFDPGPGEVDEAGRPSSPPWTLLNLWVHLSLYVHLAPGSRLALPAHRTVGTFKMGGTGLTGRFDDVLYLDALGQGDGKLAEPGYLTLRAEATFVIDSTYPPANLDVRLELLPSGYDAPLLVEGSLRKVDDENVWAAWVADRATFPWLGHNAPGRGR
jgi:hypothetical protein